MAEKSGKAPKIAHPTGRQWVKGIHAIHRETFESAEAKSNAFKAYAKTRPSRAAQAARTLPKSASFTGTAAGSVERAAEVEAWKAMRPKGGGRGVAAPRKEWVAWGSKNPNRGSLAGRALGESRKQP